MLNRRWVDYFTNEGCQSKIAALGWKGVLDLQCFEKVYAMRYDLLSQVLGYGNQIYFNVLLRCYMLSDCNL